MTYHVGIQSGHELASAARQLQRHFETVVEVASFEMVRNAGDFGSRHVKNVAVSQVEMIDSSFETGRFSVVKNDDTETIPGIIDIASSANRVNDDVVVFSAAGDEHVYRRHVIGNQAQLRAMTLLHRPHGPQVVHQRRNGDSDFDANEHPSLSKDHSADALGVDDTVDTVGKV